MSRALAVVLLAGCQAVVGIDDIVEAPCVANAPIDFVPIVLPTNQLAAIVEVSAVELTGHAKPDLVVVRDSTSGDQRTTVLVSGGDARLAEFGAETELIRGRPRFVDLDRDGLADAIVPCFEAPCFDVELNASARGTASVALRSVGVFSDPRGVAPYADLAVADVTGDGKRDVVTLDRVGVATTWQNTGSEVAPRFEQFLSFGQATRLSDGRIELVDLNGDARPDLLLARSSATTGLTSVALALHQAAGAGFEAPIEIGQLGDAVTRLTTADLDGDGQLDVVASSAREHRIWLARPGLAYTQATMGACAGSLGALADQDGDGALDVIVLQPDAWLCEMVNQPGAPGSFEPHRVARTPYRALYGIPDINQDGQPDLVGAGSAQLDLLVSGSHCDAAR